MDPVSPPLTETLELQVSAVVAGGDGLARDADGRVVFVVGALPGELVAAEVHESRKDFARAQLVDVLVPSPHRVGPPCPFVAAGCGGCDWQHVDPAAQRALKADVVVDALRRQAHLEAQVDLGPELTATGYRTTLRGQGLDGGFALRHRRSRHLVPVSPCLVAHPLVDELVREGRFPDGEVVLRAGPATGERLVVVDGAPAEAKVPAGVRVVGSAELLAGTRAWYHDELAGRRWRISARSFFQARPDGAEALVEAARTALGDALAGGGHLVDLYGGVGLFAATLATGPVTVVESSPSSAADARINLADLDAKVVRGDASRWRGRRAAAVVADPPRAGLGKAGVGAVVATRTPRLVLVSCDAGALGRDARLLAGAGYELRSATLVDLFPQTSHVEVVTRFDRR
ncbi:MAG: class I SAM-dependent RNA methyltransferase [Acidimicrobiia bacterium]